MLPVTLQSPFEVQCETYGLGDSLSLIKLKEIFLDKILKKAFVILKGFLLHFGVFNRLRSFLNGVLLYSKVDKCCPLPYSLPSGSSANHTARATARVVGI